MKKIVFSLLSLFVVSSFPISSFATPCPVGNTLAGIIGLGSCSVGDATFSFTSPPAPTPPAGLPVYFPGPFAGDSGPGPSSSQILFTPNPDLHNPGFTLSGSFIATGGHSFIPSSGLTVPGSFFDETLGYFNVSLPAGQSIMGASVALTGADVSTDVDGNRVLVSLQTYGATVNNYLLGDGRAQLSSFSELSGGPYAGAIPVIVNFSTWDRSTDLTSFAKFDAATFHFQEFTAPVPEPGTWAMIMIGLGLVAYQLRRNSSALSTPRMA